MALDLSVYNQKLKTINLSSSADLEHYIMKHIASNNAKVAFGGYLEKRGIYNRSTYFSAQSTGAQRNIHLGLDLWVEANTPIFAPLDGLVHSFKNNTNFGDYGPTIIIQHTFNDVTFYTLYGHLSLASITEKQIGEPITKGQQIATLGTNSINGDYPPHLHFQIIKDLQGYYGDYLGVTTIKTLDVYSTNCPDPNLLLKIT